MPVAPSFDDLIGQFEAEAIAQRPTLQFLDGDITEAQAHGAGAMADAAIRYTAQAVKEIFLDGAEGDALTALADDRYNIQRSPATPAEVSLSFSRTGGGAAGTLLAGFVVASDFDEAGNTVLFTTDADVPFPLGGNGPIVVNATASVRGRSGNVAAGAVRRLVDAPFSQLVTVTNVLKAGGGNEEESDPNLRARCRSFWLSLRKGTLAALELGAREVASVRVAKAIEDPVTGIVTLVVGDSDGNSTAQMVADVTTETENWRAAGSLVVVAGGARLELDVVGSLVMAPGVNDDVRAVLAPLVALAIRARMGKFRQNETAYLDSLKAAGIAVDPDSIEAIILSTPLVNTVPAAYQVIRDGSVTIT